MKDKEFWLCLWAMFCLTLVVVVYTALYWKFQFDLKADGVVSNHEQAKTVYIRVDGKPVEKVSQ